MKKSALLAPLCSLVLSSNVWAGNGANFVLYNHHTEKAGDTAVMLMSDFARDENGQPYSAQMLMVERGVTDKWTSEFMLEGQKTPGQPYRATGCPDGHPNSPTHGHLKLLHLN